MARVFLVNPPTDEAIRSPLLSFLYLAASLRRAGHEVALLDASAPHAPRDHRAIAEHVRAFEPTLVGLHTKTLYVQDAYALATFLDAALPGIPLVCGGPHPTVAPLEPLAHGFRFAVRGEGEETLVELADAIDGRRDLASIRSLTWRGPAGAVELNPSRGFLLDLDALARPPDALDLFDPRWYGAARTVPPSGLLSSRGCPAACTFCSNNVTGRRFRYRSPQAIADEIARFQQLGSMEAFSFFDDSFAVGRRRMHELLEVLGKLHPLPRWSCTAHPSHLDEALLREMRDAGCVSVDIGMESGDPDMLLRIGKGVTVDKVLGVLHDAKSAGVHCMLNLMFGWPGETLEELRTTLDFIDRAAPLAAAFNARGTLVPYPGTEIYDRHHAKFGFTEWWLREPPLRYSPFPAAWSVAEVARAYADDAAVERNFFRLSGEHLGLIREGLARKAHHTFAKMRVQAPAAAAAGAR